jgi:hypothetical protein
MKFLTTSYFIENNDFSSAMKAAAFLAAIKRGARFIYHANPGRLLKTVKSFMNVS